MPKRLFLTLSFVMLVGAWGLLGAPQGQRAAEAQQQVPLTADGFGPPLGAHNDVVYDHYANNGFDVQNWFLDGDFAPCFGTEFDELWHAGEDWFELADTAATAGDPVTAVANGVVVHVSSGDYPGLVIVIQHELPDGDVVYSMYGHVEPESVTVTAGQAVTRGQVIAAVLQWPGNPWNSHLHWEMRTFFDGGDLCTVPDINVGVAGPGYTYPGHPGAAGYLGPTAFIAKHRTVRPERISVALIIDASERMLDHDSGDQRLAAARAFVDATRPGDRVAVVAFNETAEIVAPLRTITGDGDREALKSAIDDIGAAGPTNLNAALDGGRRALDAGRGPRAAVLFSDGQHTAAESVDADGDRPYAERGWPLYTVGLGGFVDVARMSALAFETGGRFTILTHPDDLAVAHRQLTRHLLHNQRLHRAERHLESGATRTLAVAVPEDAASARFSAGWTEGAVSLTLTAPSGRQIPAPAPEQDVDAAAGSTYAALTVAYPEPGTWTMTVHGDSVPAGGQRVALQASADVPDRSHLPLLRTPATAAAQAPPPPAPTDPVPADGGEDVAVDVALSWAPFTGAPESSGITYDVYFGLAPDALLRVAAGRGQASYTPGPLTAGERYYWQVVARTVSGRTTTGPLWSFTTKGQPADSTAGAGLGPTPARLEGAPSSSHEQGANGP